MTPPPAQSLESRIVEVARTHVGRFGPSRVTIVAIAEEIGMTHANVYRHFASKGAVLDAVTSSWLRPLEASLHAVVEGADPAHDKLERVLMAVHGAYRRILETEPQLFDLLIDALSRERPVARQHRSRVQGEVQRIVEDGIAGGAGDGAHQFGVGGRDWASGQSIARRERAGGGSGGRLCRAGACRGRQDPALDRASVVVGQH